MRRTINTAWNAARLATGPLMIIMISVSCGLVIGALIGSP